MNFKVKKISKHKAKPVRSKDSSSPKTKRFINIKIPIIISIVIVILLLVGIAKAVSNIDFNVFLKIAGDELITDEHGHTNFLILGTGDKNHEGADLTDTIILASLDDENKLISMLSIPRDLYVKDEEVGSSKINEALHYGKVYYESELKGIEYLKGKVEELTGMEIHYWAKINFHGFKDLVDARGGIDVLVEEEIYDPYYPKDGTFLYETFIPKKDTLYIFMSQSWETADVRESVKMVKQKWCLTFWIVNVVWSTIARMCEMWLYTHSWIEIWVASTKNIIWQLSVLLLISLSLWLNKNLQVQEVNEIIKHLWELDKKLEWLLEQKKYITELADSYSKYANFFFLWRNLTYWTACECSLKLKELSYLHAEAYSTWELKHWPLALVWPNFPCIVINPKNNLRDKSISNIKEIKARNWRVLWVITAWDSLKDIYDDIIEIPKSHSILSPFLPLIPLWIFAVEIAKKLWKDIDKPQNLAKSVTVE